MIKHPTAHRYSHAISDLYNDYITSVTSEEMAGSHETCSYLLDLCDDMFRYSTQRKTVVDLGSGISSAVLRMHMNVFGLNVISVDTDQKWLDSTRTFLEKRKLNTDNLMLIGDFLKSDIKPDLVFYDIAYYQNNSRQLLLKYVMEKIHPDTYMLVDDLHAPEWASFFFPFMLENYEFTMHNARPFTLDKYNRYAMLLTDFNPVETHDK